MATVTLTTREVSVHPDFTLTTIPDGRDGSDLSVSSGSLLRSRVTKIVTAW
jgi:hypothetical protein